MSKLLAIAYSDLHAHPWQDFAEYKYSRLAITQKAEAMIIAAAKKANVPCLFTGDYFHDPESLSNITLEKTFSHLRKSLNGFEPGLYAISGNHDMAERNTAKNVAPTYLTMLHIAFPNFYKVDNRIVQVNDDLAIAGIPYYHDKDHWFEVLKKFNSKIKDFRGKKVLMVHITLPNCPTPLGFIEKDIKGFPTNMDKLWKNFDIVISGHIHKSHRVSPKATMLGSPIQQGRGDKGCSMGYWEVWDNKLKFKPLDEFFPMFCDYGNKQKPIDYELPKEEETQEEEKVLTGDFKSSISIKKLVKAYFQTKNLVDKKRARLLTEVLNEAINVKNY